jgi:DNA-binding CsgD family transcriptional regulator
MALVTRPIAEPTYHETRHSAGPAAAHRHADAYRSLFERSGICVAIVDLALRVQEANEPFRRELGGAAETVGRELFDYLRVGNQTTLRRQFVRLIEGRNERIAEQVLGLRAGDRLTPARLTAVSIRDRSPLVSSILIMLQWDESAADAPAPTARHRVLTELDARILQGVAMGMSTVNLAAKLYLSRQGVEYHVATMMKKLKAANRAALVSRAYAMGVLSPGMWPPVVAQEFIK